MTQIALKPLIVVNKSLDVARELLTSAIPEGFKILSEKILSDGKPQTKSFSGETTREAFAKAFSEVAPNEIIEQREISQPKEELITIGANDDNLLKAEIEKMVGASIILKRATIIQKGKSGLFGIGKTNTLYEAKIIHPSVVELRYQTEFKLAFEIGRELDANDRIDKLILELKSDNAYLRANAIDDLGKEHSPKAIPLLMEMLLDDCLIDRELDDQFDIESARPNAFFQPSAKLTEVRAKQKERASFYIRERIKDALLNIGMAGAKTIIQWLRIVASVNDNRIPLIFGRHIGEILSKMNAPDAVEPLGELLMEKDVALRFVTIKVFFVLKDERSTEPLISVLTDSNPQIREQVIFALGNLKTPQAYTAINNALNDVDESVRKSAKFVLERIQK